MTRPDVMPALVPMKAAAGALGICERQLRKLIQSGDVAAINVGTGDRPSWRFAVTDIEDFIARRRRMQCQPRSGATTTTRRPVSTPSTSGFEVIDFEDRWKQQIAAKQKSGSRQSVSKRRRSSHKLSEPRP